MPRYAAMLRGVSPMNLKMPDLKKALEKAGFTDVKTVISSGNAVFTARAASNAAIEKRCEEAFKKSLGKEFLTIVRPIEHLRSILASDPYKTFRPDPKAKRTVTFLKVKPKSKLPKLPLALDGAHIYAMRGQEVYCAHVVSPKGPVFMQLIEKTFDKAVTTRTWETVQKLAK